MGDTNDFAKAEEILYKLVPETNINIIVRIKGRDFFFSTLLAKRISQEYGTDSLEIHSDAIQPRYKFILHDDIKTTGGTAAAIVALFE